jgi:DNA (cytosine-5)-methyltransferase 1
VFVVASARDDFDPAAVLFEFEGLRRDFAPSRETGERIAPYVTNGPPFSRTGNERVEAEAMVVAARMVAFGEYVDDGTASAMKARDYKDATDLVTQPIPIDMRNAGRDPEKHDEMNRQGVGIGEVGDPAHTVTSAFVHAVAQPIAWDEELNPSIDRAGTLVKGGQGGRHDGVMQPDMAVRRLTPVECERLQGFPDNYTKIADKTPDNPRYKALGNSWAVPVVRWIGERIACAT